MTQQQLTHLTRLEDQNSGAYCDPITGECHSGFEKEIKMETRIDPVCKMEVKVDGAKYVSEYQGEKYYFCSPGCQKEFEANPAKFVEKESQNR